MALDFCGQNLRGRNFKGRQDLAGANFSHADIRGANFSGANLTGANFTLAKAGLQRRWAIGLVIISFLLSGLSGFFWAANGYLVSPIFNSSSDEQIAGWVALITLIAFFLITIRQGIIAGLGAVAFAFAGAFPEAVAGAVAVAFAVAVAGTLLSIYISWRAMKGDKKHFLVRNIAIAFAATGGTSFRGTNLTNADFTQATLKSTDFRKAILTTTRWHQAKMLDRVRPGSTYLKNSQVRQLLITGQGQDKNFDGQNLRGINLQKANLADASFIGADLSEANLQDADLSRAKLKQTQLDGTDLTGATLTGSFIEDWGITNTTKLHGVRCKYVYMRVPTKEDPDPLRKPDNKQEVFADGDFGDFIKPIFDTLDLYHNQGVDPRAIAISFKQLAENHPEAELEIVAIEKRGEDKVLLRTKTADTADKSELSAEYFEIYNQLKALAEQELKALMAEKDSRIHSLENFVTQALQRPTYYSNVEQVATMTNNQGGFSVGGSVGGNANNVQGDGNSVVQGDTTMVGDRNINTGGGNYNERIERDYIQGNYYAAGQPQSLAQAAADIQLLLKQLEQTYPTTTTSQQMVVAAEAINRIESNPTLKIRVINAVKEGGLAAFEKAIDNPAGAFIVGAIKGWQEVEAED